MNIDWPNALVGTLVGWVVGFALDRLIIWSRHIKVAFEGFESVQTNFGTLYKMRFTLKGYEDPGHCSCEMTFNSYTTFAKWDERPNPLRNDRLDDFVPEMVPATFHERLHIGRSYLLPLLIKSENNLYIFNAWWFGRCSGYYTLPPLDLNNTLSVSIRGSGFAWTRSFSVQEIACINRR